MKTITAKFKSTCAETGAVIRKGDKCIYDPGSKKVYALNSQAAQSLGERDHAGELVQAQEDAYFDNFCQRNNI